MGTEEVSASRHYTGAILGNFMRENGEEINSICQKLGEKNYSLSGGETSKMILYCFYTQSNLTAINENQETLIRELKTLNENLKTNVVEMKKKVTEMEKKIIRMEAREISNNVLLKGVQWHTTSADGNENNDKTKELVLDIFEKMENKDLKFNAIHRMKLRSPTIKDGKTLPAPIRIVFKDLQQKISFFQTLKNLKNKKNAQGEEFKIAATNEIPASLRHKIKEKNDEAYDIRKNEKLKTRLHVNANADLVVMKYKDNKWIENKQAEKRKELGDDNSSAAKRPSISIEDSSTETLPPTVIQKPSYASKAKSPPRK